MKKFLSLVLALVMTMSLVTISAGAKDFTDDSKIDYKEAVDVVSAVEIVNGYADGSFNPSATLTRGAAAKIICNMILGPTTAEALVADAAPYKDVPANSTFAGYIAFCQKEGIISGYADGTFKPGNTLTGYAFMKMLLGVLGYDANVEGYTGNNWSINVAKRALKVGLDDGLSGDFNGVKAVTREEACLYAFNALQAKKVTYPQSSTIIVGNVTVQNNGTATEGSDPYYKELFEGKLTATEAVAGDGVPSTTWKYKKDTIGTYGDEADAVYTASVKEKTVYSDADLTANYTFDVQVNGKTSITTGTQLIQKNVDTTVPGSDNGVITSFYINSKEDEGYMVQTHPVIGKITTVSKNADDERIVYVNGLTFKTEDFAKNDYVIYTTKNDSGLAIATMELAEKQTGTVTKLVGTNDVIYIDGVKYTISQSEGADYDTAISVKDVIDFYVDANGYVIKADVAESNINLGNLAFVEKAGSSGDGYDTTYKATLRLSDGSKKTVTTDVDYSGVYVNQIVTFKENGDGDIELTDNDNFYYYGSGADFKKGTPVLLGDLNNSANEGASDKVVTADTTFVYVVTKADGKVTSTVYNGYKNAPSFDNATKVAVYEKSGKAVLVYVYMNESAMTATASDKTFIIYDKDAKIIDDGDITEYYEFGSIKNGDIGTVKVDATTWGSVSGNIVTGWASLTVRADGVASSANTAVGTNKTSGEVEAADAETISIDGVTYTWADKVAVYYVNSDLEIRTATIDDIYDGSIGTSNGDSYQEVFFTTEDDNARSLEVIILVEK